MNVCGVALRSLLCSAQHSPANINLKGGKMKKEKIATELDKYHCLYYPERYSESDCGLGVKGGEKMNTRTLATMDYFGEDIKASQQAIDNTKRELSAAGAIKGVSPGEIKFRAAMSENFSEYKPEEREFVKRRLMRKASANLLAELEECDPRLKK